MFPSLISIGEKRRKKTTNDISTTDRMSRIMKSEVKMSLKSDEE